jgi:hypothetical protein
VDWAGFGFSVFFWSSLFGLHIWAVKPVGFLAFVEDFAVCTSDLETMEFDMSILHGPGVWVWFIRFLFLYTVFGYKI